MTALIWLRRYSDSLLFSLSLFTPPSSSFRVLLLLLLVFGFLFRPNEEQKIHESIVSFFFIITRCVCLAVIGFSCLHRYFCWLFNLINENEIRAAIQRAQTKNSSNKAQITTWNLFIIISRYRCSFEEIERIAWGIYRKLIKKKLITGRNNRTKIHRFKRKKITKKKIFNIENVFKRKGKIEMTFLNSKTQVQNK